MWPEQAHGKRSNSIIIECLTVPNYVWHGYFVASYGGGPVDIYMDRENIRHARARIQFLMASS
jgi:hypothetical protein